MLFMLANTPASPMTWAEIVERIGVPAAFLLLVLLAIIAAAVWTAKHVVKPVTSAHLRFVDRCDKTLAQLAATSAAHDARLSSISKVQEQHGEKLDELGGQVRQVKGIVGKIARGESSSNGAAEHGG